MNREIKFRGQRVDNGKWVYGFYALISNKHHQIMSGSWNHAIGSPNSFEVNPETVAQFTGIKDKNGVEIYEGDILRVNTKIVVCEDDDVFAENELKDQEITCYVSYTGKFAAFELITIEEDRYLKAWGFYGEEDSEDFIVIGSIHSNPELIK